MKKIVLIFIVTLVFVTNCTNRQLLQYPPDQTPLQFLKSYFIDTVTTLKTFGDITFAYEGEIYQGKIGVVVHDTSEFTCRVYSPFGQTIASFMVDGDSARITVMDEQYMLDKNDSIHRIPFLRNFRFSVNDFVHIFTGRIYYTDFLYQHPDHIDESDKHQHVQYTWNLDSLDVSLLLQGRSEKDISVIYHEPLSVHWTLKMSSFKDGLSKEIYFKASKKNYFYIRFDKITYTV